MQPLGGNIIGKDEGIPDILTIKTTHEAIFSIKPENNPKDGSIKTKQNLTKTLVEVSLKKNVFNKSLSVEVE